MNRQILHPQSLPDGNAKRLLGQGGTLRQQPALSEVDGALAPTFTTSGEAQGQGGSGFHPANFFCSRTKEVRQRELAPTFRLRGGFHPANNEKIKPC
jgi:hypothetical protein